MCPQAEPQEDLSPEIVPEIVPRAAWRVAAVRPLPGFKLLYVSMTVQRGRCPCTA